MAEEANSMVSTRDLGSLDTHEPSSTPPMAFPWRGILVVLLLTFAVYAPTLRYDFVHDDRGQIVENPAVHSWRAVPQYFTAQVWAGVKPDDLGNYYRPLFLLWLRLNEAIFGNHAWGWHLTTIFAHVLATLLVYLLVCRLGGGRNVALVAALIFGLHPAHIEAVAWISGVTEPLLGILFIASFLCYVEGRLRQSPRWRYLSLTLFALAMLEKETALILPGLLLVYEWVFDTGKNTQTVAARVMRWGKKAIAETWPYFFLIVLYIPARIYALKGFNHVVVPLTTAQLVFTWPGLIAFWIHHLVWPAGLSTFYDFPAVFRPTLKNFVLPAIFDVGVGAALYAGVRMSRLAGFFAIWLALPLVPLLNIRVFIANDFAHDRYLYMPSVGLAVLVAMLLKKVCTGSPRYGDLSASQLVACACLAAALGYGTLTQSSYFRDNLTFYAYNLARAPNNPYAEANYASVLGEQGQYSAAMEKFLDVVNHYPYYYDSVYDLALTFYKMGKLPEADEYFLRAIRLNPNKPDEYFYLGMTRFKSGRIPEAIACLHQAIAINPNGYAYHFALGVILKTQGDLAGALREFKVELANYPEERGAAVQIAEIEEQLGGGR